MKTCIKLGAIIGVISVLTACSPYRYYAIQSSTASFNKYRTFAWLPPADTLKNSRYNDIVDEKIKTEVTANLEKLGLVLKSQRPDLLVRYNIVVKDRMRIYNNPVYVYGEGGFYQGSLRYHNGRYFYYSYHGPYAVYTGSEIDQVPYREGTLILDLIDRPSGKVIWRGYGVGEVDDPGRAVDDIPMVVDGILKKLPITPAAKK